MQTRQYVVKIRRVCFIFSAMACSQVISGVIGVLLDVPANSSQLIVFNMNCFDMSSQFRSIFRVFLSKITNTFRRHFSGLRIVFNMNCFDMFSQFISIFRFFLSKITNTFRRRFSGYNLKSFNIGLNFFISSSIMESNVVALILK